MFPFRYVYDHCTSLSAKTMGSATNQMGGGMTQQQQQNRNGPTSSAGAGGAARPGSRRGAGSGGVGMGANPVGNPSEGAQIIGCELYQKLQAFLESYLNKLLKVLFFFVLIFVRNFFKFVVFFF